MWERAGLQGVTETEARRRAETVSPTPPLELEAALAAVDVAEAGDTAAHAEEREAPVVCRGVLLADSHHVLEARLAHGIAHLGIVRQIRLAAHHDPI